MVMKTVVYRLGPNLILYKSDLYIRHKLILYKSGLYIRPKLILYKSGLYIRPKLFFTSLVYRVASNLIIYMSGFID